MRPRDEGLLPTGTITFLLTDVEASSAGWDGDRTAMDDSLRDLDAHFLSAVSSNRGHVVKSRGEGDSAFAVFGRASDAVVGAYELQRCLKGASPLKVRAAIHTGEALLRDGDYYGITPNRAARLRALAYGGQIVVSRVSAELAEPELCEPLSLFRLGTYRVRDWPRAQELFGVRGPGIETDFPPLRIWGEKERAVMTIVIVDIVDSQSFAAAASHTEMVGFFGALARGTSEAFAANKGSFLKMIGDACLALFEDPANALAFARTMGRSYASTRISMHTGIIELVADDVVGRAIFEAAQLSKQAEPGRIVVSRMTADLLSGSGFNFERAFADESDELFLLVDQT